MRMKFSRLALVKFSQLALVVGGSLLVEEMIVGKIAMAQVGRSSSTTTSATFFCKVVEGKPTTVARMAQHTIPVISWTRDYYVESQETPLARCTRVSSLLQDYSRKGMLNYITYGEMDGQRVVCAASAARNPCSRLLFALDPDENPAQVVDDLRIVVKNPMALLAPKPADGAAGAGYRWQPPKRRLPGRREGGATR